ncbi:SsgA family sporulation/cell division regulator [Streptomyces sp. MK7]|uniref:SsgA family sporulation/cell division regulator n=1 Tax=Streptomyces sp. MK7 TaxID=3067635 RepID=UPI00292E53CB|nr:SsgA family sporulation/cell division regulator [Streptomyces sp. MK7]
MTVRKDATKDNIAATEEEDFDALLSASSLGSPHVVAETEPIPADVRRRLSEAAARPAQQPDESAEQDEADCAADHAAGTTAYAVFVLGESACLDRLRAGMHRPTVALLGTPCSGKTASMPALFYLLHGQSLEGVLPARPDGPTPWSDMLRERIGWLRDCIAERESQARPVTENTLAPWWALGRSTAWDQTASVFCSRTTTTAAPMRPLLDALAESLACPAPLPHESPIQPAHMAELLAWRPAAPQWVADRERPHRHRIGLEAFALCAGTDSPPGQSHTQAGSMKPRGMVCSLLTAVQPWNALARRQFEADQGMPEWLLASRSAPMVPTVPMVSLMRPSCSLMHESFDDGRPGWLDGLLLVSHLPALWRPMTGSDHPAPGMSGESTVWEQRLPDGRSATRRTEQDQVTAQLPGRWTEEAEDGPVQHARLEMAVHREESDVGGMVPVRLTYRLTDPYAVEAVFYPDGPGKPVWTFARDLLIEGLEDSAGEGDVIVWSPPQRSATSEGRRTFIRLSSPEGTALLSAPRDELKDFLEQTQHLCAAGTEHLHLRHALDTLESELGEFTCPGFKDL